MTGFPSILAFRSFPAPDGCSEDCTIDNSCQRAVRQQYHGALTVRNNTFFIIRMCMFEICVCKLECVRQLLLFFLHPLVFLLAYKFLTMIVLVEIDGGEEKITSLGWSSRSLMSLVYYGISVIWFLVWYVT